MFIDSHTHIQFSAFDNDRQDVIQKTLDEGVGFVNGGTNKLMSKKAVRLAEKYSDKPIYATVGLHPVHTYDSDYKDGDEIDSEVETEKFDYDFYKSLASSDKVVGVGECGLDYFHIQEITKSQKQMIKKKQNQVLKEQIKLSKEVDKPLVIHCRPSKNSMDAYNDLYKILLNEDNLGDVVMHFFAGDRETAEKFIDLGCYFTFGGVITFTKDYDKQLNMVPVDRLLFETDAPYVAPMLHRGERNEPRFVKEVYKRASKLLEIDLEVLKKQVLENNKRVFGVDL